MQSYPEPLRGANQATTSTPVRERAIIRQIETLTAVITSQESLISKLSEALRPAIRPLPANAVAKDPEKLAECELASALNKLMKRINDNNVALDYLIDNLEF